MDFRKLKTNKQTKVQNLNEEGSNGEVNNNLQWTICQCIKSNVHYSTSCWKIDLKSSEAITAAAFKTLLRHEAKFSANRSVSGMSATSLFWAKDHNRDAIELMADKEKFCGVQININEAKNAYFQISFHLPL